MKNDTPQPRNAATDGGPAFPRPLSTDDHRVPCNVAFEQDGMTLRQYAAVAAMQGLIESGPHDCDEHGIAHDAVIHADALLARLAKEAPNG